jgi:hypothetical protein
MPEFQERSSLSYGIKQEPDHGTARDEERGRGRPRSRSDDKDDDGLDIDDAADGEADGNLQTSSNSDGGPARKRRRSRKGLDKKFECPQKGCGKSYSRAEHLYDGPLPPPPPLPPLVHVVIWMFY